MVTAESVVMARSEMVWKAENCLHCNCIANVCADLEMITAGIWVITRPEAQLYSGQTGRSYHLIANVTGPTNVAHVSVKPGLWMSLGQEEVGHLQAGKFAEPAH